VRADGDARGGQALMRHVRRSVAPGRGPGLADLLDGHIADILTAAVRHGARGGEGLVWLERAYLRELRTSR